MMWWFTGRGGWRGGVSPDTFTANWLHVEGRGGGSVSFTGKGCIVEEGGGGGFRADTRLPLNYCSGSFLSTTWF